MIPATPKQLATLIEAGAVKTVLVIGTDKSFSITINKKHFLSNGRGASTLEKSYATLSSLFKFLHESGLGQHPIEFDLTNWTPYVPPAKKERKPLVTKRTTKSTTPTTTKRAKK